MKRTAIYARFSTELQQDRSIEDQIELCRSHADRNGLSVVAVYDDRARSGASVYGRDGLIHLLEAARDRKFDVILVEAFDRLSRDQEDLAASRDYLQQSLEIRKQIGDRQGAVGNLSNLAVVAHHLGNLTEARQLHQESLALARMIGEPAGQW